MKKHKLAVGIISALILSIGGVMGAFISPTLTHFFKQAEKTFSSPTKLIVNNNINTEETDSSKAEQANLDAGPPIILIFGPAYYKYKVSDNVSFVVTFSDNVKVNSHAFSGASDEKEVIRLNGFTGDIRITPINTSSSMITIGNIQGTGTNKSVTIMPGAVLDAEINISNEVTSDVFNITD